MNTRDFHYIRFWNIADENIAVCGQYTFKHYGTVEETEEMAQALLNSAVELGAIELDIDNNFYTIF